MVNVGNIKCTVPWILWGLKGTEPFSCGAEFLRHPIMRSDDLLPKPPGFKRHMVLNVIHFVVCVFFFGLQGQLMEIISQFASGD